MEIFKVITLKSKPVIFILTAKNCFYVPVRSRFSLQTHHYSPACTAQRSSLLDLTLRANTEWFPCGDISQRRGAEASHEKERAARRVLALRHVFKEARDEMCFCRAVMSRGSGWRCSAASFNATEHFCLMEFLGKLKFKKKTTPVCFGCATDSLNTFRCNTTQNKTCISQIWSKDSSLTVKPACREKEAFALFRTCFSSAGEIESLFKDGWIGQSHFVKSVIIKVKFSSRTTLLLQRTPIKTWRWLFGASWTFHSRTKIWMWGREDGNMLSRNRIRITGSRLLHWQKH